MFARSLRTMAWVPRWSIIRTLRTQSVAEHSFYVALYAKEIADFVEYKHDVIKYALMHDFNEVITGDINTPTKRNMPEDLGNKYSEWVDSKAKIALKSSRAWGKEFQEPVPDDVKSIVRVADMVEAILFLNDEHNMGNREVVGVIDHLMMSLKHLCEELSEEWGHEDGEGFNGIPRVVESRMTATMDVVVTS